MSNTVFPARLVRRSLSCLAAVLLGIGGAAQAATFLPSPGEFDRLPSASRDHARRSAERLNPHARADDGPLVIDDMLFRPKDVMKRSGFTGTLWENGIVYYQFDSLVTLENRGRWRKAAANWSASAHLKFVEGAGSGNFIRVQNDPTVNNSYVGMVGGEQIMNISNWDKEFLIAHEIGHALGLQHEQCRSDRDRYILILTANIASGFEHNFDIEPTTNYGAYDFDSVMHYYRKAFSANGQDTIRPRTPYLKHLDTMGAQDHLSLLDKAGMAARYGPLAIPAKSRARYQRQIRRLQHQILVAQRKLGGVAKVVTVRKLRKQVKAIQLLMRGY